MRKIEKIIRYVNIPRQICDSVLNKKHTKSHRISAGIVIMIIGVVIAKSAGSIHITIIHIVGDIIGYAMHGVGIMPVVEHFIEEMDEDEHT